MESISEVKALEPNPESLPMIAEYSINAVLRQLTESDTIAGRGYQVAGFASAVMGLAAIGEGGDGWLKVIITTYVVTILACFYAALPRKYFTPGAPKGVWRSNWQSAPIDLWQALIASSIDAYERNQTATKWRVAALLVALGGLAIQTGLVGVRLL